MSPVVVEEGSALARSEDIMPARPLKTGAVFKGGLVVAYGLASLSLMRRDGLAGSREGGLELSRYEVPVPFCLLHGDDYLVSRNP